jgi:hypothetical protein
MLSTAETVYLVTRVSPIDDEVREYWTATKWSGSRSYAREYQFMSIAELIAVRVGGTVRPVKAHDTDTPQVVCTGWATPHEPVILKPGNPNLLSHGMCPACHAVMDAQADAKQREREQ